MTVHPKMTAVLSEAPKEGPSAGKCAEIFAINKALHTKCKGETIPGSIMRTVGVGTGQGQNKEPCRTCEFVLDRFEITVEPVTS